MKIAVLGAGAYGTALGEVLTENGHSVKYYDPKINTSSLEEVLNGAEYMVLCVPSEAATNLLNELPKDVPLIVATKGFLSDKVFADFKDYMILSGPGFADEIKAKKRIKLTTDDERVEKLFGTNFLSFDFTNDKLGILMCGALKNIYALNAGILNLTPDTEEYNIYVDAVVNELKTILVANGANTDTAELSCGKGDIETTCKLPSRNYEFGQIIASNPNAKPEKTVESIATIKRIKAGDITVPESAYILSKVIEMSEKWD